MWTDAAARGIAQNVSLVDTQDNGWRDTLCDSDQIKWAITGVATTDA
jgi:hypothetical protein